MMKNLVETLVLGLLCCGAALPAAAAEPIESHFPKCNYECVAKLRYSLDPAEQKNWFINLKLVGDDELFDRLNQVYWEVRSAIGVEESVSQVYAVSYMVDAGTGLCLNKVFMPWRNGRAAADGVFAGFTGEKVRVAKFLEQTPETGLVTVAAPLEWKKICGSYRQKSDAIGRWFDSLDATYSAEDQLLDGRLRAFSLLVAPEGADELVGAVVGTYAMPFEEIKALSEARGDDVIIEGDEPSITHLGGNFYTIVPCEEGSRTFFAVDGEDFGAWLADGGIKEVYAGNISGDEFFQRAAKLVEVENADVIFCVSPAAVRAFAVNKGICRPGDKLAEKLVEKTGVFGVVSADEDGVRITWVGCGDAATLETALRLAAIPVVAFSERF